MTLRVTRELDQPILQNQSWNERWQGPDGGMIACWERGREIAKEDPELAERARNGVLVVLPWRGGVHQKTLLGRQFGCLSYLAMWQGLRNQPLDINLEGEVTLKCSKTDMQVTFTPDRKKYAEP